jgi:hypothetical protein
MENEENTSNTENLFTPSNNCMKVMVFKRVLEINVGSKTKCGGQDF